MKTSTILLIVGAGAAVWYFFIRKKTAPGTSVVPASGSASSPSSNLSATITNAGQAASGAVNGVLSIWDQLTGTGTQSDS